jgi:PmbA protein
MERLIELAKKRGCAEAEAYRTSETATPVEYEFGKLKQIRTVEQTILALRVIVDGRLGFATSTKEGDYAALVDNAVAAARFGAPVEFGFAQPDCLPTVNCYDRAVGDLSLEQMVAVGDQLVGAINAYDPKINGLASVSKGRSEVRVITSHGLDANYRSTDYSVFAGGELVDGENFLMCYDYAVSARLFGDAERIATNAVEKFRRARTNRAISSGKYPVILTPDALAQCLGPLGASIDGRAVEKGFSPWKDKIGETVAGSNVSIWDDGTYEWATGSSPFDAEGTPRQCTPIIEQGVLRNFILDRRAAKALNRKPTGNAVRGRTSPPSVGSTTLIMAAGDTDLTTMLGGVRDGVLIESLMGAWAGNPYSGQVNGNISLGYRIVNGEVTGRIKDCMLSINAFDVLRSQIAAISREREYRGDLALPYVLIDDAGISTKE